MKIALLTDGIHPYVVGGMQRHSYYLAKYFALNHVYVDLYHTSFSGKRTRELESIDCFTETEKKYIHSIVVDFPHSSSLPGHYLRESYEYSRLLFEAFMKNQPVEFVYSKGFTGWKFIEEKVNGKKIPPIGVNFHGYEMFQMAPSVSSKLMQKFFLRSPVKYISCNADCVFSYGGKITNIISQLRVDQRRIIEIPTGIEEDWLTGDIKPSITKRKFVFVGRHERRKGIEELNKVLRKIILASDMEMHFIGPILKPSQIISEKIFYHGPVIDQKALKSLLCSCDVLICPSYSEGMPNVILEAMACGLAVIATDVGAVGLMVSEKNGWLLPGIDHEALIQSISEALRIDNSKLDLMKKKSVAVVKEKFLWNFIIDKTIREISKIIYQKAQYQRKPG